MEFTRYFPQAYPVAHSDASSSKLPVTTVIEVIEDPQSHPEPKVFEESIKSPAQNSTLHQSAILDFSVEAEYFRLSFEILDVLEMYGTHNNLSDPTISPVPDTSPVASMWIGKFKFLSHVYHYVSRSSPVQLTIPAFPCKSLNRLNKVLGHLPDLGEELALTRLHALSEDIRKVYSPGAVVNIASDGVLFNDILGITDEDCWDYGKELQMIIQERNLNNLRISPCMIVVGMMSDENLDKGTFLANAGKCREKLELQFAPTEEMLTKLIKNDKDTALTYCGMVKFLQSEMATSASLEGLGNTAKIRVYKATAKKMMRRSEAFTLAIKTLFPHHVRLSMHPSSGTAKLSIALIPAKDGGFQRSPWHSCIAQDLDGSYRCVHSEDVRDTHGLVLKGGRPYFYRARSL